MEIGWLIEKEQQYYGVFGGSKMGTGALGRTCDPNAAIRFSRKEDAEAVIAALKGFWKNAAAVEHGWCEPSDTVDVFRRDECIFMYCPNPKSCESVCIHTAK